MYHIYKKYYYVFRGVYRGEKVLRFILDIFVIVASEGGMRIYIF